MPWRWVTLDTKVGYQGVTGLFRPCHTLSRVYEVGYKNDTEVGYT